MLILPENASRVGAAPAGVARRATMRPVPRLPRCLWWGLALVGLLGVAARAGDPLWSFTGAGTAGALGTSVASGSDLDGDGVPDIVVGEPGHDGASGIASGRVLLLSGATGGMIWTLEGDAAGSGLGSSLALAGDLDGDGVADVVAGAPLRLGPSGERAGQVVLVSGAGGQLLGTLDGEPGGGYGETFGAAVDGGRDLDGDGVPDLLIGAPRHDGSAGAWSGKVYVYSGATRNRLRTLEGEQSTSLFGQAVSWASDLDGDSVEDLLVGAPFFSDPLTYMGRVYAFSGATGNLLWSRDGEIQHAVMGAVLSRLADVDGDQIDEAIVAAPEENTTSVNNGKVFLLSGSDGRVIWSQDGDLRDVLFGSSVAGGGDLDGDAFEDVVIGAPGYWGEDPEGHSGWGYGGVFAYSGRTGQPLEFWGGATAGDGLGAAVALTGDLDGDGFDDVVGGAPGYDLFDGGSEYPDAGQITTFSGDPCFLGAAIIGDGLAGSGGFVPRLVLTGTACDAGGAVLSIREGLGGASGLLWIATGTTDLPLAGGHFYPDLSTPWVALGIALGGTPGVPGAGSLDLPAPDLHGIGPVESTLQATLIDAGAPLGVALSDGLRLTIGP